ncbi:hypothetical protein RQP46_003113 [Phenoliferia psychrophenolica]
MSPTASPNSSYCESFEVLVETTTTTTSIYLPQPPFPALSKEVVSRPPSYASSFASSPSFTLLPFFPPVPSPPLSPSGTKPEALPAYRATPRTYAEKCFWWGMLCPLIWLIGVSKLWRHETMIGVGKHAPRGYFAGGDVETGPSEMTSGNVEVTVSLWMEEERVWALRCAWCAAGALLLGGVLAVAFYTSFS